MNHTNGVVVEANSLVRRFGPHRAVDGVDLSLHPGESLAVFGPNGAGKTTLLRLLAGLLKPTSGFARIDGVTVPGGALVRRRIGIISHHTLLYDALTARENVEFAARLYRVDDPRSSALSALERMGISERADATVRSLSRGMKQRVSVARAMVHGPSVVLADEPFTGLDASGSRALAGILSELRESGATLIVVTHNLEEGLSVATRVAVMHRGRIVHAAQTGDVDAAAFPAEYRDLVGAV
ncbi:MAG TPA: heme ABC exporter ATP-binding protein CcmA [Gemmatimonadaceae bacterium]|jgi:heme exporter protein A